ncbi:2Fe-2S iron-sulfur cluster-binding protein [Streptomyces sp. NPDC092296]|uniref:(2Fe-2S)-binding protein n=1 Tax=Streptomyces sp. NPDC092296 TaxID=3366012 RepID=UPI0037F42D0A
MTDHPTSLHAPYGAEEAIGGEADGEAAQAYDAMAVGTEERPCASYTLRVNGADRPVADAWIGESLLYVLRERLGLAGAKDGCEQGECGACSVQVDGQLVASCLVPAALAAGSEIHTVEGLAVDGVPSDVQRALADAGAVQCGYCVPGLAMAVHDLLQRNHRPSDIEARQALCGNLCRCTGYRGVLEAVRTVAGARTAAAAAPGPEAVEDEPQQDAVPIPQQAAEAPAEAVAAAAAASAEPEPEPEPTAEPPVYQDPSQQPYDPAGYPEPGYQDLPYQGMEHQGPEHQGPEHQDPAYQETAHQGTGYQDPAYQGPEYQDAEYQDAEYQDPAYQDGRPPAEYQPAAEQQQPPAAEPELDPLFGPLDAVLEAAAPPQAGPPAAGYATYAPDPYGTGVYAEQPHGEGAYHPDPYRQRLGADTTPVPVLYTPDSQAAYDPAHGLGPQYGAPPDHDGTPPYGTPLPEDERA